MKYFTVFLFLCVGLPFMGQAQELIELKDDIKFVNDLIEEINRLEKDLRKRPDNSVELRTLKKKYADLEKQYQKTLDKLDEQTKQLLGKEKVIGELNQEVKRLRGQLKFYRNELDDVRRKAREQLREFEEREMQWREEKEEIRKTDLRESNRVFLDGLNPFISERKQLKNPKSISFELYYYPSQGADYPKEPIAEISLYEKTNNRSLIIERWTVKMKLEIEKNGKYFKAYYLNLNRNKSFPLNRKWRRTEAFYQISINGEVIITSKLFYIN